MNPIQRRYKLYGTEKWLKYIKIPIGLATGLLFAVNSPADTATAETTLSETILYEVKPGDTLLNSARNFGKNLDEVAALNGITDINNIQPGQMLVLEGTEDVFIGQASDQTNEEFVEMVGNYASQIADENGLYASVMIAQAILESGHGNSTLSSVPFHNLFGIKGTYEGDSVVMATSEYIDGQWIYPNERFRKYPDYEASFLNNAQVLRYGNSWDTQYYSGAWVENTNSYLDATAWLEGRYATDPNYSNKLNQLINRYDLTRFDSAKNPPTATVSTAKTEVANDAASAPDNDYSTHTVEPGDTLFNIANRYGMTVSELQQINNLRNHHITLGQALNVIGTAKVESTDSGTHTVAPGDTLYNISNRYGMTVTELQQLNGLSSNHITLGQTLNVNGTSEVNNTTAQTHTVGPKDTLYNISNRYGMTVAELQQLNELESNHIIIGQTLKVSGESVTTHIVGVGDTIYNIANRYDLTVDELKAKNGLTSDVIKIGQELNI